MKALSWVKKMLARKPVRQAVRGKFMPDESTRKPVQQAAREELMPGEHARGYVGLTAQGQAWRGVSAQMGEQPRASEFHRLLRK